MTDAEWLAAQFEGHRSHLRSVAYRMLGSLAEAEDAVQEAWLRLSRTDAGGIDNLAGWLTTVVGRVCLNMLRARRTHPEEPLPERVPDPVLGAAGPVLGAAGPATADPEQQAVMADSVGLALQVVLGTLSPAERLAFVLHDMFAVPFEEIGPIVGRTPTAARQLASRARRRVQGAEVAPEPDLARHREVVDAFLAAAREGDFDRLLGLLDPDVVLLTDDGTGAPDAVRRIRGARVVAEQALFFAQLVPAGRPALVNGGVGMLVEVDGKPRAVGDLAVRDGRITRITILAGPRLRQLYPTLPTGV